MSLLKRMIIFLLAFCSIVYELLLAQTLAAFLENTVLRYSITIGLYMFAMGIGSMLISDKQLKRPVLSLLQTELLLSAIGGFSVIMLHTTHAVLPGRMIFLLMAHILMILIGLLTGFEIPLLMAWKEGGLPSSEFKVLGVNYFGAFVGAISFAFVFYPRIGLLPSALMVGCLNALAGTLLFFRRSDVQPGQESRFKTAWTVQLVFFFILICFVLLSVRLNEFFINLYLR
jgi:spermidine synthase